MGKGPLFSISYIYLLKTDQQISLNMIKVNGTFQVKMTPLETNTNSKTEMKMGRMSLEKSFHGPLSGDSNGEMLTAMTTTKGSAGYVAIEQFEGTLENKNGTFILQHFGIMHNQENRLILEIVPASGTHDLEGISGQMEINLVDGQHEYILEYAL